ncbi:MAG TPA: hypothetical protein VMV77_01250 [Bacteroidales bacterium]|nr:hypothetical protein [Bacteroidales bacterium]
MSKSKHTPGPWKLNPQPNPNRPTYYAIYSKTGGPDTVDHICQVTKQMSENWQANAQLIAAAPVMLDALKRALTGIDDYRIRIIVKSAIVQAEKEGGL